MSLEARETTSDRVGKRRRYVGDGLAGLDEAVTGSESDALSESESDSDSDESARQEKALGLAKREMTVAEESLSMSGRVRVGFVLSCLLISACLALSVRTTDEEDGKTDTVARGRDQETEGLRDSGEEHKTDERRGVGVAARTRTRLDCCPSDLRLGKAGEACKLVSS